MFGIFNRMFRTSKRTEHWNPPSYWTQHSHLSSFERQQLAAQKQREQIARDMGLF